jgi:hypothetical protein
MQQASAPAAARSASHAQTRKPGPRLGAKLIGGLGAVVTVATVAAFMMSSSPQPSTTMAPQAATTLAAVSAPAPVNVAAPVTTATVTPPAVAAAPALAEQKDCKLLHRRFYLTGQGTIRLRTDGYISPAISLGDTPQMVDLPMLRPTQGEAEQKFVFEGKAPFLILTTDYADFHQGLTVNGSTDYDMTWVPLKNC